MSYGLVDTLSSFSFEVSLFPIWVHSVFFFFFLIESMYSSTLPNTQEALYYNASRSDAFTKSW